LPGNSNPEDAEFDYICCSIGTGTISELSHQKVLGFPALKGFLKDEIRNFVHNDNWELITSIILRIRKS
jgi:1-aminocyclopropane-1-carboxylate deaminase